MLVEVMIWEGLELEKYGSGWVVLAGGSWAGGDRRQRF